MPLARLLDVPFYLEKRIKNNLEYYNNTTLAEFLMKKNNYVKHNFSIS